MPPMVMSVRGVKRPVRVPLEVRTTRLESAMLTLSMVPVATAVLCASARDVMAKSPAKMTKARRRIEHIVTWGAFLRQLRER